MTSKSTASLLFATLLLLTINLHSQVYTEQLGLRLQAGPVYSAHSADVTGNADILNCGQHTSGSGIGFVAQLGLDLPLSTALGLGFSASYAGRGGTFTTANLYPARDPLTGSEQPVSTELQLQTQLSFLEIQADVRIPLIGTFEKRALGLVVGPRIALPITSRFVQSESIVSPADATFIVGSDRFQERTIQDQAFTTRSSMLIGGTVGAETLFPLSDKTSFTAQVSADYFFNNLVIDSPWKLFGIRAEVGLRFSVGKTSVPQIEAPPPPPDVPTPIAFAPLRLAIETSQFSGQVVTGNVLLATVPIVNAVFFDSASAAIPASYRLTHDGSKLSANPVEAHAWLLPRIATIVNENPNATIQLIGASSNQGETENVAVASARVESVKSALVRLGIAESRISTSAGVAPKIPSNSEFAGGRAENRRVDIQVQNAPLQRWVNTEYFAELRGSMYVLARLMGGDPQRNISSKIHVKIGSTDTVFSQNSPRANVEFALPLTTSQPEVSVKVQASSDGAVAELDTLIDLSKLPRRTIALKASGFEACLRFEYNSGDLSPVVKDLLSQLVERLPTGSTISILGSADILGSEERNKKLSELRAANTEQYIRSLSGNKFKVSVGTKETKLSDVTPQGRFLNRSIWITVSTPE
ncbi:MAG: OmpA family protein [Ignavibacteria bacterium]|nr:OmpA family protein [Ignavibacteria bacterium]